MKKKAFSLFSALILLFAVSSCYTLEYTVGKGAQTGVETKGKNHFLIYGLAPLSSTSPVELAGDAKDYTVVVQHSFIDGLLASITFGIYTPTTTKVIK